MSSRIRTGASPGGKPPRNPPGAGPGGHSASPGASPRIPRPGTPRSPGGPATSSRGLGRTVRPVTGPGSASPNPTAGLCALLGVFLGRVLGAAGLFGLLLRGVLGGRVLRLGVLSLGLVRLDIRSHRALGLVHCLRRGSGLGGGSLRAGLGPGRAGGCCRTARAAAAGRGGRSLLLDQFDDGQRRVVTLARTDLGDPCVTTLAGGEPRADL